MHTHIFIYIYLFIYTCFFLYLHIFTHTYFNICICAYASFEIMVLVQEILPHNFIYSLWRFYLYVGDHRFALQKTNRKRPMHPLICSPSGKDRQFMEATC